MDDLGDLPFVACSELAQPTARRNPHNGSSDAFPAGVVDLARFSPLGFCDKRMKRMSYFHSLMSKTYAAIALLHRKARARSPSIA
jgi:hypothetical protein